MYSITSTTAVDKIKLINLTKEQVVRRDRTAIVRCAISVLNRILPNAIPQELEEWFIRQIQLGKNQQDVAVKTLGYLSYNERSGKIVLRLKFFSMSVKGDHIFNHFTRTFNARFPGGRKPDYVKLELQRHG